MKKIIIKTLLFLFVFLCGISFYIIWHINITVENFAKEFLRIKGIEGMDFKIIHVSPWSLELENLTWKKYCLSIKKIHYHYSIKQIVHSQLGKLSIQDVESCYQLNLPHQNDNSPSVAIPSFYLPSIFPYLKPINFSSIEIKNFQNRLHIDNTPYIIHGNFNIETSPEYIATQVKLDITSNSPFIYKTFSFDNLSGEVFLEGKFSPTKETIIIPSFKIHSSNKFNLSGKNISLTTIVSKDNPKSELVAENILIHELQSGRLGTGLKEFALKSNFILENHQLIFNTTISPTNHLFNLAINGTFDLRQNDGLIKLQIPRFTLPNKAKIEHFYKGTLADINNLNFEADLNGVIRIKHRQVQPMINFNVYNMGFSKGNMGFDQIQAQFKMNQLTPLNLKGDIQASSLTGPLPIKDLKTKLLIKNKQVFLNSFNFNLWEGNFLLGPTTINLTKKTINPSELNFTSLDLKKTLDFINKPDLRGTGKIKGKLPLTFDNLIPVVTNGQIFSEDKGHLQLLTQSNIKQMIGNNQYVNILTDYLENLSYDELRLNLSTNKMLDIKSQLKISGNNPDLKDKYQNRPLDFKVTLNFNIVKMLESQGASLKLPEKIEKMFLKDGILK